TTAKSNDLCPDGWIRFEKQCYVQEYVGKASWLKFDEAQNYCKSLNASMVSIHSKEENDFVSQLMKTGGIWLAGQQERIKSSKFNWIEGSEFNYTNWDESQKRPLFTQSNYSSCIAMAEYGYWYDERCSELPNAESITRYALCVQPTCNELCLQIK
ncbi:low affinity immunoglobulin epsilon Fc receptor-like protein, partial [Leptotrombidium deliense]